MRKLILFNYLLFVLLLPLTAQIKVTGKVKDNQGETIPGANVLIKETNAGTVTDIYGNYVLENVPPDATLIFSYVGMLTEEIPVQNRSTIDVILVQDILSLDEVVVIGYGTVKRSNLTGAVVDIKAEEILDIPSTNLSTLLQGRLAGVKVSQATGKPGASTTFKVRTESTFGRAQETPLFVIDGVVRDQNAFDLLDPTEVESISVLKDAAASVYGARAAGGVVLVKTKNGKEGKAKISYSSSYGLGQATQFPEMLNSYQLANMYNDILDIYKGPKTKYDYFADDELEYFKSINYDWLDGLWKNTFQQRQTLNISGGSERVNYFTGASYYRENGSLENLYVQKYGIRTNIEAKVTTSLTASLGIDFSQKSGKQPYYANESQEGVLRDTYKQLLTAIPWVPPTIDGKPVNNMVMFNPYGLLQSGSYKSNQNNHINIRGALEYELPVVKGLKLRIQYSRNENFGRGKQYAQNFTLYEFPTKGSHRHIVADSLPYRSSVIYDNEEGIQESTDNSKSYQLNASISYGKKFGKHDIAGLLVYEQSESSSENYWTRNTSGAAIKGYDYIWAFNTAGLENGSGASETGQLSYIGRLNYSYEQKYILEATFRHEASQKFHPDHRWQFYPAVSAGWVISEESFAKEHLKFINFFKIRASYGRVGNDDVPSFQWKQSFYADRNGPIFGSTYTNAIEAKNGGIFVPNLTWQKTNSYNAGIDLKTLRNHISFTVDYYYRYTYDILERRSSSIPITTGASGNVKMPEENHGAMYAKGIEAELRYDGRLSNSLQYHLDANFSWDRHRKLKVFQNPAAIGQWDDQLLNDPSNQPGWICLGVINTQEELDAILAENPGYGIKSGDDIISPELGMLYYKDLRGESYIDAEGKRQYAPPDGIIDDNDKTIIAKYTNPPYHYGFAMGASWKGLKVDLVFNGEFGHKVFVQKDEQATPDPAVGITNVFAFWSDYWTPENTDAAYPRPYKYGLDQQMSTFWMRDGHTLRLNTLTISYSLPANVARKLTIGELRIFFTAQNLWTIINPFDHKDPSVAKAYDYPMIRNYNLGVNITL
jgi:TonB-linked SusC/RagA family outer membrane protein